MAKSLVLKNKTLIIGCGRFGASIANKCDQEGKNVMVIDIEQKSFDHLDDRFSGYTFVGDATDPVVLEEAHIESVKEIIIATGKNNINTFIAHLALKVYDIESIYVRLDTPDLEPLISGTRIKAIYPFQLTLDKLNELRGEK